MEGADARGDLVVAADEPCRGTAIAADQSTESPWTTAAISVPAATSTGRTTVKLIVPAVVCVTLLDPRELTVCVNGAWA